MQATEQGAGIIPYQFHIKLHIFLFQSGVNLLHFVGDATLGVIQTLNEIVPDLRHEVGETEESICFCMFCAGNKKSSTI